MPERCVERGESEPAGRRGSVDGDAHGRALPGGPGCAREGNERRGATGASTRAIARVCGRDPERVQGTAADGTSEERAGQGSGLHGEYVAETGAVPGVRRSG